MLPLLLQLLLLLDVLQFGDTTNSAAKREMWPHYRTAEFQLRACLQQIRNFVRVWPASFHFPGPPHLGLVVRLLTHPLCVEFKDEAKLATCVLLK